MLREYCHMNSCYQSNKITENMQSAIQKHETNRNNEQVFFNLCLNMIPSQANFIDGLSLYTLYAANRFCHEISYTAFMHWG